MDYRYYIWSSYAWVLLGLGWLLWDSLTQARRVQKAFQERSQ